MVKLAYDLHIHSGLSPCASQDMTPNNIVNMALIKGLDVISVTDHNRALNVGAVLEVAKETDLIVIPGIEVESTEGIHVVCYFEDLTNLLQFESLIYKSLPPFPINLNLFEPQLIFDAMDQVIGEEGTLLATSCNYRLEEVIELCHQHGGIVSLAHIERNKHSILKVLGFIPKDLNYECLETNNSHLYPKLALHNSDAHQLGDIHEAIHHLEVAEKSLEAIFAHLRGDEHA